LGPPRTVYKTMAFGRIREQREGAQNYRPPTYGPRSQRSSRRGPARVHQLDAHSCSNSPRPAHRAGPTCNDHSHLGIIVSWMGSASSATSRSSPTSTPRTVASCSVPAAAAFDTGALITHTPTSRRASSSSRSTVGLTRNRRDQLLEPAELVPI
jgi:hypothetical protein